VAKNKHCDSSNENIFSSTMTTTLTTDGSCGDRAVTASKGNNEPPASTIQTAGNVSRTAQSHCIWDTVLASAQVRGFFGTVSLEATVQDGTIQSIRRRVEQIEK